MQNESVKVKVKKIKKLQTIFFILNYFVVSEIKAP